VTLGYSPLQPVFTPWTDDLSDLKRTTQPESLAAQRHT